jgi:hypothetical protein
MAFDRKEEMFCAIPDEHKIVMDDPHNCLGTEQECGLKLMLKFQNEIIIYAP